MRTALSHLSSLDRLVSFYLVAAVDWPSYCECEARVAFTVRLCWVISGTKAGPGSVFRSFSELSVSLSLVPLSLRFFPLPPARFLATSSPFLPGHFDENGPNSSLLVCLVQGFPTLVSELKSDISFFPSRVLPRCFAILPGHFDEHGPNSSLLIRLDQGFPTPVSESKLELSLKSYPRFTLFISHPFFPIHCR
jgi:hypothetical protein